jgi:hypothetical protein
MSQVLDAWENVAESSVSQLFNGSDPSIDRLWSMIQNGQMIEGSMRDGRSGDNETWRYGPNNTYLKDAATHAFYGYSIPAVWSVSGIKAFILDASDYPCGTIDPLIGIIPEDVGQATYVCYNNKMYYLLSPQGVSSEQCTPTEGGAWNGQCSDGTSPAPLSAPPGVQHLGSDVKYGRVTLQEIVYGYVSSLQFRIQLFEPELIWAFVQCVAHIRKS